MNLPLFPLPIFLLPGGVSRLRVFEARYTRLVQESAGGRGFVIFPINNLNALNEDIRETDGDASDHDTNWGSWVKIINFEIGPDGLLLIDVKCEQMVRVKDVEIEHDGLKRAKIESYSFWGDDTYVNNENSTLELCHGFDEYTQLKANLTNVFEQNQKIASLYSETKFDVCSWVCQRWLELLPLKQSEQNIFAQPKSFGKAKQFLSSIVFESEVI